MMKKLIFALPLLAISLPVMAAEDLIDKKEFKTASDKAGDMSFTMSLAQTARLLEYCGKGDKAKDVRDYLQPVTLIAAGQAFKDVDASETSKKNMRGMFLSRNISAAIATELSTASLLDKVGPLDDKTKGKLCAFADEGYDDLQKMRAHAKAAGEAIKQKADAKADLTRDAKGEGSPDASPAAK